MNLQTAEAELNRYLDRAAAKTGEARPGQDAANAVAAMWQASERAHERKQREENRTLWFVYFSHLAHSCRQQAERYEARAEALLEESGGGGAR